MRIQLKPGTVRATVVDVVAKGHLVAAGEIRTLALKSWVAPVLLKGQDLVDTHRVHGITSSSMLSGSGAENPVSDRRPATDFRLARRERAPSVEGIRCEPEVASDDVAEDPQESLAVMASDVSRLTKRPVRVSEDIGTADRVGDRVSVPVDDRIGVVVQALRHVAVRRASRVDAYDPSLGFCRILDLPSHVLAVLGLRRDQDDHRPGPIDSRTENHFHGTAFSGLIGGAIEVFVRSEGWTAPDEAPRPLPYVEALPNGAPEAELTIVVPVLGVGLASAVEDGTPWRAYVRQLREGADNRPSNICVLPVQLPTAVSEGALYDAIGDLQSIDSGDALCRDIAQAIAQFAQADPQRLTVFLSHTKRGGPGDAPEALVRQVRELILDTKLEDFFDAQDLQPGSDWSAALLAEATTGALLAIRTDLYASREWCQKEVLVAKRAGMPVVILDALTHGEERGSFLMDHMPRIPLHRDPSDDSILRALGQLVDECLKRALWQRQQRLAARSGSDVATWWAPHAPSL